MNANEKLSVAICFGSSPKLTGLKGEGKCCGRALKAAGGVEVVDVVRIRAPKK